MTEEHLQVKRIYRRRLFIHLFDRILQKVNHPIVYYAFILYNTKWLRYMFFSGAYFLPEPLFKRMSY